MTDAYENYKEAASKYGLPDFKALDTEFEVSLVDSERFITRSIIQKMIDRVDYFALLIESIIQPETSSMASMHECRAIDEQKKNELYQIFKGLMQYHRYSIEISLLRDEQKEVDFINEFYAYWNSIKEKLIDLSRQLKTSWMNETHIREELEYLG